MRLATCGLQPAETHSGVDDKKWEVLVINVKPLISKLDKQVEARHDNFEALLFWDKQFLYFRKNQVPGSR